MGDHVLMMGAQFSKPESMRLGISESKTMALLISFLANRPKYGPMIASVNKLQKDITEWCYASMLFIE